MWGEGMEFFYHSPTTEEELATLLQNVEDYRLLAGGTDVLVRMKQNMITPANLVDLQSISSFKLIKEALGTIEIGPMTTHAELVNSPLIRDKALVLAEAAGEVGAPQIRNRGTVGGNICNASPAADTAPALLVLDATVEIKSRTGIERKPLSEFFLSPGKSCLQTGAFISKIIFHPVGNDEGAAFAKHGARKAQAIAIINGAAWLKVSNGLIADVRIALGAVAPTPVRLYEIEKWLIGKKAEEAVFVEAATLAAKQVKPISDVRSGADHRLRLTRALVTSCLVTAFARVKEVCSCE